MLRPRRPTTMTSLVSSCSVCGETLDDHTEAFCNACGRPYHLNQRQDLPGKDCGEVWINEEHLGLEFACNTCLHPVEESAVAALDDVLDQDEAAAAAGISSEALESAALAGAIVHRRTARGMLLFARKDVLEFAQGKR
jgi:hypothetical protein